MARPAYSLGGPQIKSLIVSIAGMTLEALVARTTKIAMPEKAKIVAITLNVAAKGGTPGTDTLDVLATSTSLLAAVFNLNTIVAGTPVEKVSTALSSAADAVAKDTVISITTAQSGGSSPTIAAATVQIDYVPVG